MSKYSLDQLKQKLTASGWRTITGNKTMPLEGTLAQMAEAAHARHVKGQAAGYLQEIETEIEVDMLQLQELWQHLGLPTI
jgi:hypothetical protein